MLPTGKVEVITGTSPHGQGHETAWSQLVADRLGVAFEDVEVLHGDTQVAARGLDTYGSRSLTVGGMAVLAAADKVIEKAKPIAAQLLEANVDDLEFSGGRYGVRGTESGMTLGELAFAVFQGHKLGGEAEGCLDADATHDPDDFSFPHGTHLCAVEVDTETGATTIRSYVSVDDIGKVINPLIVEGQVHGGLAQGIAQALYEEAVHDESGTLVTGSFDQYLVPGAPDLPSFETARTETPATTNPLGVKGVGEAGTIASTPAVVNAVIDAVRHLGVSDIRMPCTPYRVWKALQGDSGADAPARPEAGQPGAVQTGVGRPDAGQSRAGQEGAESRSRRPSSTSRRRRSTRRWPCCVSIPTRRCWPAVRVCCRCCGCGWRRRSPLSTSGRSTNCVVSAMTGTRW
jgi:carbon-monoxide dehydrogenase large subunit